VITVVPLMETISITTMNTVSYVITQKDIKKVML